MKKACLLLLVLIVLVAHAFQPPAKPIAPKAPKPYVEPISQYYLSQVFNSIQNGKQHAPMLMILDQLNDEKEDTDNPALSLLLARVLVAPVSPILITGSVLKNLLVRTKTYQPGHLHSTNEKSIELKKIMEQAFPDSSVWSIYDVPQSQFVLLIPKSYSQLFAATGKNLGIKKLPSLDSLLPKNAISIPVTNQTYQDLIAWLNANKNESERTHRSREEFEKILSYDISKDLEKVFTNKTDDSTPIWDIFIDGHGTNTPPIITGLSPAAFNKMLAFFDQKIKTGIVYILSCSAGGQNKTLLETTKDGVQTNHTFTLILGSISNSVVITVSERLFQSLVLFLNNAGFIQDKGTSINNLMRYITQFNSSPDSYHGATNFPQIWFPGGYGFQTPQIVNGALTLGNVFLKTYKENNLPIKIENILVALVYPQIVDVPLVVSPVNLGGNPKKGWKDLAFMFEPSFFANVSAPTQQSIIDGLKAENILPDYLSQLPGLAQVNNPSNPNYYLYPQFISMAPGKAHYLFSNIKVATQLQDKQVAGGVLQFIRDAFFDPVKKSEHTYLIDSLTGTNDISVTLAASRLLAGSKDKHPLEELLKDKANKEIILKNVIIDSFNKNISFQIDDTTWIYGQPTFVTDPTKQMRWNFKILDSKEYEKLYKTARETLIRGKDISQKNISEVLQEKQRQVLLKKTVELKQKEDALKQAKQMPIKLIPITKPAPAKPK